MTSRFDIERAVAASDLPKLAKLLMMMLLMHADNDTAQIKAKYSPSLTCLARETSMDRSTVERNLRALEAAGWISRTRPSVEQSRKHVRTRYRLTVPLGAQGTYPETELGAHSTQARCTCHLELGAQCSKARCPVHPLNTLAPNALDTQRAGARSDGSRNGKPGPGWLEPAVDFVIERLTATTTRTYDRRDITGAVTAFLSGKTVTNPGAYIRKCATENVLQFEPTPTPPRYQPEGNP